MAELTLEERLRCNHVKRWQIVRVAREQNVAEHLYQVRVLTLAFAEAVGFGFVDTGLAEQWALEHDVPEVITGDLNTKFKALMREAIPNDNPVHRIELSLSNRYARLYDEVKSNPHVRALVKLADHVEAVHFLTIEGMGVHAKKVQKKIWDAFNDDLAKCRELYPDFRWTAIYDIARALTGA